MKQKCLAHTPRTRNWGTNVKCLVLGPREGSFTRGGRSYHGATSTKASQKPTVMAKDSGCGIQGIAPIDCRLMVSRSLHRVGFIPCRSIVPVLVNGDAAPVLTGLSTMPLHANVIL